MLGTLTLDGEGPAQAPPFGRVLGSGLDARLFTDLSTLTPDTLIIPNERFFIRTTCPPGLRAAGPWTIALGGLVRTPREVTVASLRPLVRSMGTCVIECAGNNNPTNFGLMSAARWDGIPLTSLLDRVTPHSRGARIAVSGVDDFTQPSQTSVPGAAWIFSRDDLERTRAFLATGMNGVPLLRDHGLPVRLVVPGWYGCACIKWVTRIDTVGDDEPATTQMTEFARRTHQNGEPALAREFTPAVIDTAAMPVRVEKWTAGGRIVYRVVGLRWGGSQDKGAANALQIRFKTEQPWAAVDDAPAPAAPANWSVWSHLWRPETAGRYRIVLRVNDPAVRTRRLDIFFYTRGVTVEEV
jgi:DMSO/TMAO reductase YedYZ molybdopterin-dependent catalytic subunit